MDSRDSIQREELPGHLLANFAVIVAVLNFKVGFEEIDDRQIGCGFAIGDRAAFEDQPSLGSMRMDELEEQP